MRLALALLGTRIFTASFKMHIYGRAEPVTYDCNLFKYLIIRTIIHRNGYPQAISNAQKGRAPQHDL